MTKKEALEKMMTPEMKDGIRELQSAVEVYNRNSNDITYGEVILAFFTAAKYEKVAFCPVESMHMDKGAFEPGKVNTTIGKCYVLCTSPEEAGNSAPAEETTATSQSASGMSRMRTEPELRT